MYSKKGIFIKSELIGNKVSMQQKRPFKSLNSSLNASDWPLRSLARQKPILFFYFHTANANKKKSDTMHAGLNAML